MEFDEIRKVWANAFRLTKALVCDRLRRAGTPSQNSPFTTELLEK
ncbi:hypothetical protein [uncultured Nostoc sp.]